MKLTKEESQKIDLFAIDIYSLGFTFAIAVL